MPEAFEWVSVEDGLPRVNDRWGPGVGYSEPVLVCFGDECDDNGSSYAVWRFRRGGCGDLTTEYWDFDWPLVTHWAYIP